MKKQIPYVTSIERRAIKQGLIEGIELGLELKFGSKGLELLPEISKIENIDTLKSVREALKQVSSTAELRSTYQTNN
ncbi:MAG: hypothetical protein WA902_14390 [Thermosynechococcaceae cyanobacterium]